MNSFHCRGIVFCFFVFSWLTAASQSLKEEMIDLSGRWAFQTDQLDKGVTEKWYVRNLSEYVSLPGSMATNGKGDNISVNTPWTGSIFDSSWFFAPEYSKYRQPGNIKVPFWLQPNTYYVGAAWYQKKITIPTAWHGKHIELYIERSHWESTVWVDGKEIGTQNSLSTAQVFDLTGISAGMHQLSIRVDNRIKEINVGPNAHSITDHTQTNWNGLIGKLYLSMKPDVYIDHVELFPDVEGKNVRTRVWLHNSSGHPLNASLSLLAVPGGGHAQKLKTDVKKIQVAPGSILIESSYSMGNKPLLWDEFHPNLYSFIVQVRSGAGTDQKSIELGMRTFSSEGTQFTINGRKTFLRGTLECAIFPKTGFPPTDTKSWQRIFLKAKSYGLNHIRFHSWCPPEAAFAAADREGMYLHIECGSWANQGAVIGDGKPLDGFIYEESERIVKAYGNHPSFCMMAYGNEPAGKNHKEYLTKFVEYWKQRDNRRLYTTAAGWPIVSEADYNSTPQPRIQAWGAGLKSVINREPPKTSYDWSSIIAKWEHPTVSHEIGQWCVYPDFKEIKKYTGVLKAKNFEIFQDKLREHGMGDLADSFLLGSGKLQVLCYKADIEAALRTKGMGGFQLLDLHDFPGQGTALVGVLSPFWEDKGYTTAQEYSQFCNSIVPLARFPKMVYVNNEEFSIPVEIAQFGDKELRNITPTWVIKNSNGKAAFKGVFKTTDIPIGNGYQLGEIRQSLLSVTRATKFTLVVSVGKYHNSWDFFVYPNISENEEKNILVTQKLDEKAVSVLNNGGKVLLTVKKGTIKKENGGNIAVGFSSIFWNTAWTNKQPPHTLGILCNPSNPALKYFPTDYHSNWQWWDAMSHSDAIILDSVSKNLKPIVRVIDDWVTARPLGLLFECKVGNGKLLFSSIDLLSEKEQRPEARQLMYSLLNYMKTDAFEPKVKVDVSRIENL